MCFLFGIFFFILKEKVRLAAAEDQKNRNDQNPNAVVIKKIAKAVVIHKYPPFAKGISLAILAMKIDLTGRSVCFSLSVIIV